MPDAQHATPRRSRSHRQAAIAGASAPRSSATKAGPSQSASIGDAFAATARSSTTVASSCIGNPANLFGGSAAAIPRSRANPAYEVAGCAGCREDRGRLLLLRLREAAAFRNPDAGHRHAAACLAPRVGRVRVQQHLHFAQPAPPARRIASRGQPRIDRAAHGGKRCGRQVRRTFLQDEPGVGTRRVERQAIEREMRVERRDHRPGVVTVEIVDSCGEGDVVAAGDQRHRIRAQHIRRPGVESRAQGGERRGARGRGIHRTGGEECIEVAAPRDRGPRIAREPGQRRRRSQHGRVQREQSGYGEREAHGG